MFWSKRLTKSTSYTSFYMAALLFNNPRNGTSNSLYLYTYGWLINFLFINLFNESFHLPKGTVTGDELDWRLSIIHSVNFRFEIGLNFSVMELLNFPSMLRIFLPLRPGENYSSDKKKKCPTRRADLIAACISCIFNVRICYYEVPSTATFTCIIPVTDNFSALVKFYCFDCVDNIKDIEMVFNIFRM